MTMQTLRERSQAISHGASSVPMRTYQSCEIVACLEAPPDTTNDQLIFQAKALFEGPHSQPGQLDTYAVRADRIRECLDNLSKGAGAQPGSVLVFGNAWRDAETGVVSIGWVTTAISAQKAQAELNGHQNRRVEAVFAQMPVLEFSNTRPAIAEPERIRWPLGLDSIEARVNSGGHWQTVAFDRQWLTKKLTAAWDSRQQEKVSINMRLPVIHPDQAVAIHDLEGARNAIVTLLTANRYRNLVTRISDGETVETRRQPMMRGDDPAVWADKLLSQTRVWMRREIRSLILKRANK
ncbi:MAG: hypothetical protein HC808_08100 [Candidatus Competibacteraceae bacterium]|nr:hypothetical protein [Candidatus Competibacteraceae bacterium]